MKQLVADYRDKGVDFIAIQPNDPKAVMLSELGYTDVSDSLEEMKIRAKYRHFNFPYLYDGETQNGVTSIKMSRARDASDMLAQESIDIGAEETARQSYACLREHLTAALQANPAT